MTTNQKITVPSVFFNRARCKSCFSKPYYYFYIRGSFNYFDHRDCIERFEYVKTAIIKRMSSNHYLKYNVKDITSTRMFNHVVSYKGILSKLYKNKNNPNVDYAECFVCKCNQTAWYFSNKTAKVRPEILNRKAKFNLFVKM